MDIKGAYQEARRSSNGGKGREEASRGASLRSGGEDDVASYAGTLYGGRSGGGEGPARAPQAAQISTSWGRLEGDKSRGDETTSRRRRRDSFPITQEVVTSAVTSTFSLTHPPSFRHGRSLVRRADRRVNASGVAGASSFPTTTTLEMSPHVRRRRPSPANKTDRGRGGGPAAGRGFLPGARQRHRVSSRRARARARGRAAGAPRAIACATAHGERLAASIFHVVYHHATLQCHV